VLYLSICAYFWCRDEALAVEKLKRPITGPELAFTESPSWSLLKVNHYWTGGPSNCASGRAAPDTRRRS
jgi:hypothetical protein